MEIMLNKIIRSEGFIWFIFLVLAYFLIFMHLDWHPLYVWDEGLFANRAYYWAEHGRYFTNWLELENCDLNHANTKPPLMSLVQALSFKIFGFHALALRIPIALCGLLTCFFIIKIMKNWVGNMYLGLMAALVLLSNPGYNAIHILKSGDHDAALALFLFLASISLFLSVHSQNRKRMHLLLFFVFTGLGVLTKSLAGFMMMPGALVYVLSTGQGKRFFSNKWTYIGGVLLLLIVSTFYLTMNFYDDDFLALVWKNEVNRYGSIVDNHSQSWNFYLLLLKDRFAVWLPFVFFGAIGGLASANPKLKKLTLFILVNAGIYFVLLSAASTKLEWYIAPIYPMLAILGAIGIYYLFIELMAANLSNRLPQLKPIALLSVLVLLAYQTGATIKDKYRPKDYWNVMIYERFLWQMKKDFPEVKQFRIHTKMEWYPNLIFLANMFNDQYGYKIDVLNSKGDIHDGDLLYGFLHPRFKKYNVEKVIDFGPIEVRKVYGKKQ